MWSNAIFDRIFRKSKIQKLRRCKGFGRFVIKGTPKCVHAPKFPARLEAAKTRKEETVAQLETAKIEVEKPFVFEDELKEKTERLNKLNIELNLDEKDNAVIDDEPEQNDEQPEKKSAERER